MATAGPIRPGQVGPGPMSSPLPFRGAKGARAGLLNQGKTKKLIGPQTVKPRPPIITPPKHPIGYLHHSQKKQSEPFSHWSPQPQAIQAVSPLVSFDNTPTVSHSAAANQVTVPVELSGITKRKKKSNKKRRMMMNREASQSDELSRKNKQEVGGASKPQMEIFFFCSLFLSFLSVCVRRTSVSVLSFPTADFSAMHHGTIDR